MTLFISFAPSYQYILAWATLHFSMLHHCISSVLCCKLNNHCAQGPSNDYTHAYSLPPSNLSSLQSLCWSLLVFWLIIFLSFLPSQSPLLNWRYTIWTFTWIGLFDQSTLQEGQCTLHILKLGLIFIFLRLLLPCSHLLICLSLVGAWYLTTTPTLSSFVFLFSIKIGYFCFLFWAYDWPTVANVDPSSSAACIAALRSRGF